MPFGAVWTGPKIMEFYDSEKLVCGLTNYAHPLGLAALGGVLDLMEDSSFQSNKKSIETVMSDNLAELAKWDSVAEIRCRGLLAAIDLKDRAAPTWEEWFGRDMHIYSKQNMIVIAPPFVSTPDRLAAAFGVLKDELSKVMA